VGSDLCDLALNVLYGDLVHRTSVNGLEIVEFGTQGGHLFDKGGSGLVLVRKAEPVVLDKIPGVQTWSKRAVWGFHHSLAILAMVHFC
jgi:hypothetical protein